MIEIERVHNLNEKEIIEFSNKYNLIWDIDILEVSLLVYEDVKEYLVNDEYFIIDYGNNNIVQRKIY